jgi:hypothetical protein
MKRTTAGVRKSRTHFEQIPLVVVKKIAEANMSTEEEAGPDGASSKPASRKGVSAAAPAPRRKGR